MNNFLSRFNQPLFLGGVVNVGAGLLIAGIIGVIVRDYDQDYLIMGVVGIALMFVATYEGKK